MGETDSIAMSLFSLCPLLIGEAGESQDHSRQGLSASVLSKAQGQLEAREATDYEIVLLKPITGATELRLLRSRGSLRFGRFSRISRITAGRAVVAK